jgi:hypothetical protein
MSTHSKKSKRMYSGNYRVPNQATSPSAFLKKETVPQTAPREVQQIESVYEFFTKQRPLSWTPYSATVYDPLLTTGSSWSDDANVAKSLLLTDLDVNECLVLSYLEAKIMYRPIPDGTAIADINPGYFVSLDVPSIPPVRTIGASLNDQIGFVFDLRAQESSLYDASIVAPPFAGFGGMLGLRAAPSGGFTRLNTNVLERAENSSALYMFESGPVTLDYLCIDSSSGAGNAPQGFFPYGLAWSLVLGSIRILPTISFDVRGHRINKNDAELLKTLLQNN